MAARPVVVGIDGSEQSLRAVDWAAREAALHGAPLRIVSGAVSSPRVGSIHGLPGPDTVPGTLLRERESALTAAAERAAATAPGLLIDVDALNAGPDQGLIEAGSGASMLVLGARGAGAFTALILGSVSQYASAHATCPVVVVREETTAAHRQVGVGIGDPARSAAALAFAFEEASLRKASLIAVHAVDMPDGQLGSATWALATPGRPAVEADAARRVESALAEWQAKYPGVQVSTDFVQAHPGRALVGLSARADLVVIGRRTRPGGLSGLGAVRHAVLNHAHGPIATVPSV
jgi:nucleotide-binding universal stress UspA family protein